MLVPYGYKLKILEMKRMVFVLALLFMGGVALPQSGKLMPVTTSSKLALELYNEAIKHYDAVNTSRAIEAFDAALSEDPDFFMANYQLAMFYLMNESPDNFRRYSYAAVNCKAKLSEAEELLQEAIARLRSGSEDATDIGRKLVDMYPGDPDAYNCLISFLSVTGETEDMVETIKKALTVTRNAAPFYNQLGYAYLNLKQEDKAKEAFDRYIQLDPKNPNVYDSKGDYFMYTKQYDKAYELYMKAHSMDPSFSEEKARMAQQLYEQEKGRRLQVIPM